MAGFERSGLLQREIPVRVAEQGTERPEEGSVEVCVDAAQAHEGATVVGVGDWRLGDDLELSFPPPLAAGVVNVTADSFYSGARSVTPEQAVADGQRLVDEGFDLLDVGAVAARSGPPVDPADEAARLAPAIAGLVAKAGVPVLADTFSVEVARAALDAGAAAINDISGGSDEMFALVAEAGCGYVLMHIEGPPREDRTPPRYGDVVAHQLRWFSERIEAALAAGVAEDAIALDPGPDFDKGVDDNVELLRRLGELRSLGRPLFAAISRKDFLGALVGGLLGRSRRSGRTGAGHRRSRDARNRGGGGDPAPPRRRGTRRDAGRLRDRGFRVSTATPSIDRAWRNVIANGADDGRLVATSFDPPREAVARPPAERPPGSARARPPRRRDRRPLRPPERGARRGRPGQRDRHVGHRLGKVALVQPAGAGASGDRPEGAGALPLPDEGAGPGPGAQAVRARACPTCAMRSTTATPRARTVRGFAAART